GKRTMAVRLGRRASIVYIFAIHLCATSAFAATAYYYQWPTLYIPASLAFLGGSALSIGIARTDGAALNKFLGMSAALECICGLSIVFLVA
ncbi:MAG: hypothetical protein HRU15_15100, partial [Planctomycetes bacterium]|nr:hypothetical protein [Planctomycetota bacterium]